MDWGAEDAIAIAGTGFSGVAVGLQLMRALPAGATLCVLGREPQPGRGVAYGTACDSHLLNVPAGRLGWDPQDEGGFARWLVAAGHEVQPADFVPRCWMADYLQAQWEQGLAAACARGVRVQTGLSGLRSLRRLHHGWHLESDDGRTGQAAQVLLATGHLPPQAPSLGPGSDWQAQGFWPDPWQRPADWAPAPDADVLLVGSGLTAVDLIIELRDRGHRGRIHLVSRRGQMPQPHRVAEARPRPGLQPVARLGADLHPRAALAEVRAWVREAEAEGLDWRDVMASLRAGTPRLWQRLSLRDRQQFLRHLQPWWDTHRHRMPPALWQRLQDDRAAGGLLSWTGRLAGVQPAEEGAGWRVTVQPRDGGAAQTLQVQAVVNCTGPSGRLRDARDPLLAGLRDRGLLSADALGLGLLVDAEHHPLDCCGVPVEDLYYVGPMLKAQHWEAIAIPELRVHAQQTANSILDRRAVLLDEAWAAAA